jgi:hypothetical protein
MKAHGRADLARVSRAHSQIRPLRWGALRSLPEAGLTKPAERSDLPTEIGRRTTDSHPSAIRRFARQPAVAKLPSERGGRSLKPCCFEQIPIATERRVQEGTRGRGVCGVSNWRRAGRTTQLCAEPFTKGMHCKHGSPEGSWLSANLNRQFLERRSRQPEIPPVVRRKLDQAHPCPSPGKVAPRQTGMTRGCWCVRRPGRTWLSAEHLGEAAFAFISSICE